MTRRVPMPTWRPERFEEPAFVGQKMMEYTNGRRAFVVYRCGTVVFSESATRRADGDSDAALVEVVHQAPDFRVIPMQDGNFLIRFAGPVCGLVAGDFFAAHVSEIRQQIDCGGYLPGETVIAASNAATPIDHRYVGLFARAKLYCDYSEMTFAVRYDPIESPC